MKQAMLVSHRDIVIADAPEPAAGAGEVVIQVFACGVCGTDVHIFNGDKGAADNPLPIVLGHEFAGVVAEVGAGVAGLSVGDRVCVDPNKLCGACAPCQGGYGHFCERMLGIGTMVNGGFAQYCSVPASQAYKLDDRVSFAEGAMAEPLACCLHGADLCEIRPGDNVVVFGGGMIGLLMVQLSKLSGAACVALVEPVSAKRAMGMSLGADICIDPHGEDVRAALDAHGVRRVSCAIECVGRIETMRQAIDVAGCKSTVMLFGLSKPDEALEIKPFDLFKREVALKASYINPYTMPRAVGLINSRRVDVSRMVAEVAPLSRLPEILASAELRRLGKFIVNPQE